MIVTAPNKWLLDYLAQCSDVTNLVIEIIELPKPYGLSPKTPITIAPPMQLIASKISTLSRHWQQRATMDENVEILMAATMASLQ
ncbi:hypothetical protein GQX74_005555 [Glossina fuscipes]|nr:hypothetical protein GQX74_005555 [Glossina fuscipes]